MGGWCQKTRSGGLELPLSLLKTVAEQSGGIITILLRCRGGSKRERYFFRFAIFSRLEYLFSPRILLPNTEKSANFRLALSIQADGGVVHLDEPAACISAAGGDDTKLRRHHGPGR